MIYYCEFCQTAWSNEPTAIQHRQVCPEMLLFCKWCGLYAPRYMYQQHLEACVLEVIEANNKIVPSTRFKFT